MYVKNNSEAVLTSTHNQCFREKYKKKVLVTWMCYPDDISILHLAAIKRRLVYAYRAVLSAALSFS